MAEETLLRIKELLDAYDIDYGHIHHETIPRSSQGASEIRGTSLHKGAKALVLKTKSGRLFQAVVPAHRRADLKALKQIMSEKNVSLASPDNVFDLTGCIVGSVPPFGKLWEIQVYIDRLLLDNDKVVFSAGTLEDSITIDPRKLVILNDADVVDISRE
ncbi:MAG: aminoacyl-tRNA deacylase [Nanobdellota archaeon]